MSFHQQSAGEAASIQLGQACSVFVKTGNSVALKGQVFVAITFLEASVFESGSTGLVEADAYRYPNSAGGATLIVSGSEEVDSYSFAAGITIYGRWTAFELASGAAIAYVG